MANTELNSQSNLYQIKNRGSWLLVSEKFSDCCFLVGPVPYQRLISGHKLILAMASPVFERMLYGSLRDKNAPIPMPDVLPDVFQTMLEYIYTDCLNITSFDKACQLCYVAKKYMLPYVVEKCTKFLCENLNVNNACRAYEFAKLFDEPHLMKKSMETIAGNTREVLLDPIFFQIEMETLMAILDQDELNIDSELDLFNGLVKYATEHGLFIEGGDVDQLTAPTHILASTDCAIKAEKSKANNRVAGVDTTMPNDVVARRVKINHIMLRQAVKKIRFLTLTPEEFARGPARSKLLQQKEALDILIKITVLQSHDNVPMPQGFCTSRSSRNSRQGGYYSRTGYYYHNYR